MSAPPVIASVTRLIDDHRVEVEVRAGDLVEGGEIDRRDIAGTGADIAARLNERGVSAIRVLYALFAELDPHRAVEQVGLNGNGRVDRATPPRLTVRTACEICKLPDPVAGHQLLGPLLRRGCRTVIGGHTGEGKSTFVMRMLAAFVARSEFLGYAGAGGRVLVIDLEQGVRSVKKMLTEAGLSTCDSIDVVMVPEGLALDKDEEQRAEIEQLLAAHRYEVLVLDPYYKAHTGDSNDERQVDDLMRMLDRWRAQYGFALILPAHRRKTLQSARESSFTIDDIYGAGAFLRGAEVVIGLRRQSIGYSRLYFFKDRDGDLPVSTSWGLLFSREDGFRRDPSEGVVRDLLAEIRAFMADGAWRTAKEISAPKKPKTGKPGIGAKDTTVKELLLEHAELFESTPGKHVGKPPNATCFRLNPTTNDAATGDLSAGVAAGAAGASDRAAGSAATAAPAYIEAQRRRSAAATDLSAATSPETESLDEWLLRGFDQASPSDES